MKTIKTIKKEYAKNEKKLSILVENLIGAGYGDIKPSQMRTELDKSPLFKKYIELSDRQYVLMLEARGCYGPDFKGMWQL